jgi:hypothetical protein
MERSVVQVRFRDTFRTEYDSIIYRYLYDIEGLEIGDLVAVMTKFGVSVGLVVGFSDSIPSTGLSRVIQKIDMDDFVVRLEKAAEEIERKTKKDALKKAMRAREKEILDMRVFENLAAEDKDFAEIYAQYKAL